MAAVNPTLFSWDAIEAHSDLERLRLALDYLPDQPTPKPQNPNF